MESMIQFLPAFGILALIFVFLKNNWVSKQEVGNEKMERIAKNIADGAMSFLKAEYKILSIFVVAVAILLFFKGQAESGSNGMVSVSFIVGAVCSALAGFIGMKVATKANVRTTNAAQKSLGKALEVAFAGGSVMGLGVVGLGVLGLSSLFAIYSNQGWDITEVLNVLSGFSLGASSIALFARVGGGIYTKAADVGADLVGKVEAGIPEDHPWYRIIKADLFVLALLACSTFGLAWSFTQFNGQIGLSYLFLILFVASNLILFGGVYWSKFAHMFYKPGAAIQKNLAEADGSRDNLPPPADAPEQFGLGIKREEPKHY